MLLAKLCYCFFRVAKLPAQFDQAVAQPTRGPLGRLKPSIELVDHIGIGDCVGEFRGSRRIVPRDGNIEYLSLPASRNAQRSPQPIYAIVDSPFRRMLDLAGCNSLTVGDVSNSFTTTLRSNESDCRIANWFSIFE